MALFFMIVMAAALAGAAVYAQASLPRHIAGSRKALLTRVLLILLGLASGWVLAAGYAGDPTRVLLAGLIGFGAVHFPAAFILFVKQERGSGKS
ncbi:MAG TPA: hypothetical protein VMN03_08145 [Burkholderiales bacterium]|nr:hypothetical protein [Burkholderiales bacterium]